ncbi:MAG: hypothetical protein JOZ69_09730 [Myxococcales bacterium]|nr:hypothetical protein [Myxococcales bacterium]
MIKLARRIWRVEDHSANPKWIGTMASTHGKPCSCKFCRNRRADDGPSASERRRLLSEE